jgi:polyferredoxin
MFIINLQGGLTMSEKKKYNLDRLRIVTQVISLIIFFVLFRNNSLQRWIVFFGAGILVSLLFGRFYCGWICPMDALIRPISWLYKKLGIKRFKGPDFMRQSWFRWLILTAFVGLMIISRRMNFNLNIILYLSFAAVIFSLFFEEALWHKSVCPFGTILSLSGRVSKYGLQVDKDKCVSCGNCERVCTNNTIIVDQNRKREIINNDCLLCFKCEESCPTQAISYQKL